MKRDLLTASLLSSWHLFVSHTEDKKSQDDFLKTLKREPFVPNEAMQAGIDFENEVMAYLREKDEIDPVLYTDCIREVGETVRGGSFQVKAKRELMAGSRLYLMYGRIDVLKADTIYDIKFTVSEYEIGKYIGSPQHKMYFYLVPEIPRFVYLTSNGERVWTEEYRREDCTDILEEAADFDSWLNSFPEFKELYEKHWLSF
jgi:hypothetical protein